jgi:hypothetical protein
MRLFLAVCLLAAAGGAPPEALSHERLRTLAFLPHMLVAALATDQAAVDEAAAAGGSFHGPGPSSAAATQAQIAQLAGTPKEGIAEAERQRNLGRLHDRIHETAPARAAYARAAELYRAALRDTPDDAVYQADLLILLQVAGKTDEAAAFYPTVVRAAERDARC